MLVVRPNPRRMRYMRDSPAEGSRAPDRSIFDRLRWGRVVFAVGLAGAAVVGVLALASYH
jgi:hypothetical protein